MKAIILMSSLVLSILLFTGCSQQINQTQFTDQQPKEKSAQNDNMKIYRNDKYSYEFQYPKDWQPGEVNDEKSVTFFQNNKEGRGHDYEFSAAVIENINQSAAEFLMHDKSADGITREKTTFLGQDAIKITNIIKNGSFGPRGSIGYHFVKDGNGFSLSANYAGEDSGIGEKILNSFKFTK